MTKTLEAIIHEVLELPRRQQLRLAHYLLSLDEEPVVPEVEAAWEGEIAARIKAYDEGRLETVPWESFRKEMQERLQNEARLYKGGA